MGAVTNAPTAIDVLLESFGRIPDLLHDVVDDLDADTLIRQPVVDGHPNNSIGWIVWHIGRMADAQIADITDSPEVHAGGWAERLGVPAVARNPPGTRCGKPGSARSSSGRRRSSRSSTACRCRWRSGGSRSTGADSGMGFPFIAG